jgi:hypothetical protein
VGFRRVSVTAAAVAALGVLGLPGGAAAQSPADDLLREAAAKPEVKLMPATPTRRLRRSRAPVAKSRTRSVGAKAPAAAGSAGRPGNTRAASGTTDAKLRTTCRRAGGRWTCRVRRSGAKRPLATCRGKSKARTRDRCLEKAGQRLRPGARASSLGWQGFPAPRMSAVGRLVILYPDGYGTCTGTVVSRTLVLAAGHCFGPQRGNAPTDVVFLPGATWGASNDPMDYAAPYGKWIASNWWPTGAWASSGDPALDWALVEIPPANDGRPISAFTGSWRIQPNINFSKGAQIYSVGYPSSGYWSTTAGGLGRGQYACSGTWDGLWERIGSGWELFTQCTMNRGASGGPWFVKLGSGEWVVGGINNRCKSRFDNAQGYCDPYSDFMRSSYLDGRFNTFWNSVQPLLRFR